ncbi:MAG TPA: hypothetical protein PLE73_09890 [Spirochaetota bacterium]|nr:hypothetical protein [Spirochaetota bacterium]HOS41894.1 hypothetical protein [Spirochaetota bacterium]HPI23499.1 hypothetical protein [Spirochaetota bacterium]HPU90369.1 hypothetical protein [Spirochaetota bacterium]
MNILKKAYPAALIITMVIFAFSLLPEMYVTWYLFAPAILLGVLIVIVAWDRALRSRWLGIVILVVALVGIQPILDTVFFAAGIACCALALVRYKKLK